jgi:predicted HicB family RNase H-like nuclease
MEYKGFVASYHFVERAGVYVAEVLYQDDVIAFSAQTIPELYSAMIVALDHYFADKQPKVILNQEIVTNA